MNSDFIKVVRNGNYAIGIVYDENADSPRYWDNLGKLYLDTRSLNVKECSYEDVKNARVKLPVYKYEHGGIALGTSNDCYPFNSRWDSCLAGYIIAMDNDIRNEYNVKRITKNTINKVIEAFKAELDLFEHYINGNVYGYTIYKASDNNDDGEFGELIDSCYGYYSIDDALSSAMDYIQAVSMIVK